MMEVQVLRGIESLPALRSEWDLLQPDCFRRDLYLSYDWFHAQLTYSRFQPDNPLFLRFLDQGRTVGIAPMCLTRRGRLLPLKSLEIIGTHHSQLQGCAVKSAYAPRAAEAMAAWLQDGFRGDWDYLFLDGVSPSDPFVNHLEQCLARAGFPMMRETRWANIVHDVPEGSSLKSFLDSRSRRFRKTMKRSMKIMDRSGKWEVVLFQRPGPGLMTGFDHYYQVMANSWKQVRDPDYHRKLGERLAEKDCTRLFILYYQPYERGDAPDEPAPRGPEADAIRSPEDIPRGYEPIAAYLSFKFGDKANMVRSHYHRDYAHLSPGRVLLYFVLSHYLDMEVVRAIDFQRGEESYKMSLGKLSENRELLWAANPGSLRGRCEFWAEHNLRPLVKRILALTRGNNTSP